MKLIPLLALLIAILTRPLLAQFTAFTYQGTLTTAGAPASGPHDMTFRLFTAATGGTQVGPTLCVDDLPVTGGTFTVQLDFGAQFTTVDRRFLEIQVRSNAPAPCTDVFGYITLSPRQELTPAPMAIRATRANAAFALDAPDGSPTNALFVDNSGNIGIGTTTPSRPLHIKADVPILVLQDVGTTSTQSGYIDFLTQGGTETAWLGFGSAGSPDFSIVNARTSGNIILLPFSGNVGIGTQTPTAKLEVHGDVRLGSSGQYRAPGGEENLRIIRGKIGLNGQILLGTGFTCTRLENAKYRVTFNTPFPSTPSVTATAERGINPTVVGFDSLTPTPTQVTFVTYSLTFDEYRDSIFDFIVIGPR